MTLAYAPDALIYNTATQSWSLRPDYDVALHRVDIRITDDDVYLDGDWVNGEVGDDVSQTAEVYDLDGTLRVSGRIYDEEYYGLAGPNGTIWVERMEIGGQLVGYLVTEPLTPGTSYSQTRSGNVGTEANTGGRDTRITYGQVQSVPCFGSGVHLETDHGPVPVDWLAAGDRVLTLDHGYQPILWVGRTRIAGRDMTAHPSLRPVLVPAGRFGEDGPVRDLVLSPEHRVLIGSAAVEYHFGTHEALAACKFLEDADGPWPVTEAKDFSYYHVLFARHELVRAEGLWVESLFAGDIAMQSLDPAARRRVEAALRPHGGSRTMQTARYVLTKWECQAIRLADWPVGAQRTEGARYGSKIA